MLTQFGQRHIGLALHFRADERRTGFQGVLATTPNGQGGHASRGPPTLQHWYFKSEECSELNKKEMDRSKSSIK
jgi:hypothetical protein